MKINKIINLVLGGEIGRVKKAIGLACVLFISNINAIVDSYLHPEIHYFDTEHLIVGSISAIFSFVILSVISFYVSQLQYSIKQRSELLVELTGAKEKAEESENNLEAIIQSQSEGVCFLNQNEIIEFANHACGRIFETETKELIGAALLNFLNPDEIDIIINQTRNRKHGVIDTYEIQLFTISGVAKYIQLSASPKIDENNIYLGAHIVLRDITKRRQADEEINQLNSELEQRVKKRTIQLENSNKELEAFSYSVAHNLRSPLRGIDGWSLAMLEDCNNQLDEKGRNYLMRLRSEAQQMGSLIDDLLKLSRVTLIELKPVSVDLTAIVQTIVNQLSQSHSGRKFEFRIEPGLVVFGDLSMIQIVLTNLLDNACKFTSRKPIAKIQFGKLSIDGNPTFFVSDNGVGFEMEYMKRIFGAFQRMHKQSEFPGAGIGLATVQRIISRHGGRIWADSKPGEGATFYFTIS
jgi:PAS domain S-box-containing protein